MASVCGAASIGCPPTLRRLRAKTHTIIKRPRIRSPATAAPVAMPAMTPDERPDEAALSEFGVIGTPLEEPLVIEEKAVLVLVLVVLGGAGNARGTGCAHGASDASGTGGTCCSAGTRWNRACYEGFAAGGCEQRNATRPCRSVCRDRELSISVDGFLRGLLDGEVLAAK